MIRGTAAAVLLALLATGCGSGSAVNDLGTVVEGAKGTTVRAELPAGRRFSLAVPASADDAWDLVAVPDAKVASYISEEHEGATDYFVFNTKYPGTAEIRLRDCRRCGGSTTPSTEESRRESGEAIFAITVK
ncbi:MAG: hypothetical protein HOV96_00975 [Nonomuraea sp.]|nr:hypothetical protein [Nonomuraea sp.]NUP69225.1 hypothetical protein [Nonomuraea sp.]NUP76106.1 hypothetical protein [Nonomuraea sp.]NUS04474.1 hypothetical protein [Nonomuraea sp.]